MVDEHTKGVLRELAAAAKQKQTRQTEQTDFYVTKVGPPFTDSDMERSQRTLDLQSKIIRDDYQGIGILNIPPIQGGGQLSSSLPSRNSESKSLQRRIIDSL